jgi:beta-lactam-binding protein with PASTA domain
MRTLQGRNLLNTAVITLFVLGSQFIVSTSWAAPIKNGDTCSPEGATYKQSGTEFVCTKSGSKVVWKSKKKATPTPTAEAKFTMPKVVGMNLQLAQDLLQSKGSYILDQEDFKGLSRFQINDSNWKVCKQSPAPGKSVPVSTVVTLYSVKLTERC